MRTYLIQGDGGLAAIHEVAASSIIQNRNFPKINEYNGTDW